jgi:hypothetical protein
VPKRLCDNARYYDPGLGRFISADSIAPGKDNPQNRNRYSYTLNNPLIYTDPTGHCGKKADVAAETKACAQAVTDLEKYNIHVGDLNGGLWSSDQLRNVATAAALMVEELFGRELSKFLDKIGYVTLYQSAEASTRAWFSGDNSNNAPAVTSIGGWGSSNITFYQDSFKKGPDYFIRTAVHELGHAWDIHSWGDNARDLRLATGSDWSWNGKRRAYRAEGKTTEYGRNTDREDWAESVAETVLNPPRNRSGSGNIDETRERVVFDRAK